MVKNQPSLFTTARTPEAAKVFNQDQIRAIQHGTGPLIVVAGPGAGKTTVIIERAKWIVNELGVHPSKVAVTTFTKKAKEEAKVRLEKTGVDTSEMFIGTIHSLANKVLTDAIPSRKRIPVNNQGYEWLVSAACREINNESKKNPDFAMRREVQPKDAKRFIGIAKSLCVLPDNTEGIPAVFLRMKRTFNQKFVDIYRLAEEKKKNSNITTHDDMITDAVLLLRNRKHIKENIQKRYEHVIIDEFQDTNLAQLLFIEAVAAPEMNITAVGDEDQSVYAWRGATPEYLVGFCSRYEKATMVTMGINYRCPSEVVAAAQNCISHNEERTVKSLSSASTTRGHIQAVKLANKREEAQFITQKIQEEHEAGTPYGDMVITYRMHVLATEIEDFLYANKIPYTMKSGSIFYEQKEINGLLSYLHLLRNPFDVKAGSCAIRHPFRKIGKETLDEIKEICEKRNVTYCEAIERTMTGNIQRMLDFAYLIESLDVDDSPSNIIREIVSKTDYIETMASEMGPEADDMEGCEARRIHESVDKFLDIADQSSNVLNFLDFIEKDTKKRKRARRKKKNAVQCMSIHSAKGLEAEVVFLAGANDGALPSVKSVKEGFIEEERRLFYVAMTRTKRVLFVTSYFGDFESDPAPFIKECLLSQTQNNNFDDYEEEGEEEMVVLIESEEDNEGIDSSFNDWFDDWCEKMNKELENKGGLGSD